jgi:hypothetical protein
MLNFKKIIAAGVAVSTMATAIGMVNASAEPISNLNAKVTHIEGDPGAVCPIVNGVVIWPSTTTELAPGYDITHNPKPDGAVGSVNVYETIVIKAFNPKVYTLNLMPINGGWGTNSPLSIKRAKFKN